MTLFLQFRSEAPLSLLRLIRPGKRMELVDLFISVAGRSTRPAWERLKDLSDHPLFETLVEQLHQASGTIAEREVEETLTRLIGENGWCVGVFEEPTAAQRVLH